MDTQKFTELFDVIISRYDLYPSQEPTCHAIGFNITHKTNGLSMYIDTQVPLSVDCNCERMKCKLAWENVKETVYAWAATAALKSSLLNTPFVIEPAPDHLDKEVAVLE